jgi:hypothetical protein
MSTRAELLEQAKEQGLAVNTKTTKSQLETMLGLEDDNDTSQDDSSPDTENTVQPEDNNSNGEKTNGTTLDGNTEPVTNETSIPQNGQTEVETTDDVDNPVTQEADAARTGDQVKFADESNPNQKARDGGAPGETYDQDGNLRTGGYSYGVAAEDFTGTSPVEQNKGKEPEESSVDDVHVVPFETSDYLNGNANNVQEWSVEDQNKLADSFTDDKAGIRAGVTTSAGDYVRIKFFRNNKPIGTYTSRKFVEADARSFLKDLRERLSV